MNTALSTVRETDVTGVLCFYVDMGRPASAAHLIFRQGMADEPLPETGWLHLLEHLALLDRETLTRPVNGEVSMLLTRFAAFGQPDELVENLGALCRWVANPDFRLLARERGVLQARAHQRHDPLTRSLTWRYGANGPGVTSYAELGALRATPDALAERAWHVFNAANAILVLDGPPPADLKLPLPSGEYLPPAPAEPVSRRLPAAYRDSDGLTLSGVVSRTHEASFLPAILERAVHDGLRQSTGGAYAPWSSTVEADDQHLVVGAGSDVVPEILGSVAGAGLDVVRRLAEEGVPRAWVDEAVQQRMARLGLPSTVSDVALEAAYAALSGRVPLTHEEMVDQLRDTDPQLVDNAARELDATLLVGLPDDAKLPRGVKLVSFPDAEPASEGKRHTHVNWPADLSTFAADDSLVETVNGTTARSVRIGDVVGMFTWRDGTRQLVAKNGSVLEMEARQWFNGERLAESLDAAVPADLQIPMPDREVTFRRMGLPERCAIGFARAANTKPGLIVLISVMALLALLSFLGGHRLMAFVLVVLGATLGGQLWRIEGGQLGARSTPPSPGTA
jgi:zinc protease